MICAQWRPRENATGFRAPTRTAGTGAGSARLASLRCERNSHYKRRQGDVTTSISWPGALPAAAATRAGLAPDSRRTRASAAKLICRINLGPAVVAGYATKRPLHVTLCRALTFGLWPSFESRAGSGSLRRTCTANQRRAHFRRTSRPTTSIITHSPGADLRPNYEAGAILALYGNWAQDGGRRIGFVRAVWFCSVLFCSVMFGSVPPGSARLSRTRLGPTRPNSARFGEKRPTPRRRTFERRTRKIVAHKAQFCSRTGRRGARASPSGARVEQRPSEHPNRTWGSLLLFSRHRVASTWRLI